jgi:hypothetical protein
MGEATKVFKEITGIDPAKSSAPKHETLLLGTFDLVDELPGYVWCVLSEVDRLFGEMPAVQEYLGEDGTETYLFCKSWLTDGQIKAALKPLVDEVQQEAAAAGK